MVTYDWWDGVMRIGLKDNYDHCSISEWCFNINRSIVSWSSKKQSVTATLIVEAEYIALSNATREAILAPKSAQRLGFLAD